MRRLCTWGRYAHEDVMFMRSLCLWGRYVHEDVVFLRTLGIRLGFGLGLGLGIGLVLGIWCPTSIEGGKRFLFSSMCFYILHPPCHAYSFNSPPPPLSSPLPFYTHRVFWTKTGMFGLKTPCLCLFYVHKTRNQNLVTL